MRAREVEVEIVSVAVHLNDVADMRCMILDLMAAEHVGVSEVVPDGGVDEL